MHIILILYITSMYIPVLIYEIRYYLDLYYQNPCVRLNLIVNQQYYFHSSILEVTTIRHGSQWKIR